LRILPPDVALIDKLEKLDLSLNPVIPEIDQAARKGVAKLIEYLKSDAYDATYYQEKKKGKSE